MPVDIAEAVEAAEAVLAAAVDEAVWAALAAAVDEVDWAAALAEVVWAAALAAAAWAAEHVPVAERVLAVQDRWEAPWAAADRRGDREGDGFSSDPDIMTAVPEEAAAALDRRSSVLL